MEPDKSPLSVLLLKSEVMCQGIHLFDDKLACIFFQSTLRFKTGMVIAAEDIVVIREHALVPTLMLRKRNT